MKFNKIKLTAFTLAELLVVFVIIGVILSATAGIYKAQLKVAKKYQYYAAFTNLKHATAEIIADGFDTDTTLPIKTIVKYLPDKGNFDNTATQPDGLSNGLCQRISNLINTVGTVNCNLTKTTEPFAKSEANFIATNGIRFFNFGVANHTNSAPNADATDFFIVYVDIDGDKGTGMLNDDVHAFKIYRSNQVIPYYNNDANSAGMLTEFASTTLRYENAGNYVLIDTGVPYLEAACHAGVISGDDCPVAWAVKDTLCDTNVCEVVINRP